VVVEFGEKKHIGSIGRIGLQVHVGMRNDSLLECVEYNNLASAVIEGIGISGHQRMRPNLARHACMYSRMCS